MLGNKEVIAVGGLGGSGTRMIAEILIRMGIFFGEDLNIQKDNRVFGRLLKNPNWFANTDSSGIKYRLGLFDKYMKGEGFSLKEMQEIIKATVNNPNFKRKRNLEFYKKVFLSKKRENVGLWGWKEPNNQIFIDYLFEFFRNFKYIHILRHGLDMAFSNNKYQLRNWGWRYGVSLSGNETEHEMAEKQLDFWIRSTEEVVKRKNMGRMLIIKLEDICSFPRNEINRIEDFCGLSIPYSRKKELFKLPSLPNSILRWKDKDLSVFRPDQIKKVEELGYQI